MTVYIYIRLNTSSFYKTDLNGAVFKSSAVGLAGTGFSSQYRLKLRTVSKWVGERPLHPLLSH